MVCWCDVGAGAGGGFEDGRAGSGAGLDALRGLGAAEGAKGVLTPPTCNELSTQRVNSASTADKRVRSVSS